MRNVIQVYPDQDKPYTLFTDASKYVLSAVLAQGHASIVNGKTIKHQIPITYFNSLFQGSQLDCTALSKEAFKYTWQSKVIFIISRSCYHAFK